MLPSTLPPPSRAATSMARRSLEYIRPRFSSVADFFRLIWAHFECPDISGVLSSARQLEEAAVQAGVPGHLRMERGRHQPALPNDHGAVLVPGQDVHALTDPGDRGGPDEHAPHRPDLLHVEVGLEGVHLAAVGVAFDPDVHEPEEGLAALDLPGH